MNALTLPFLCLLAAVPAPDAGAPPALPLAAFAGSWECDAARSDSPEAVFEVLHVPRVLRWLAPRSPTQRVSLEPGAILTRSSFGPEERLVLDGKTETHLSMLGTQIVLLAQLEGDTIVAHGTARIDGKTVTMRSTRHIVSDELTVTTTFGEGATAAVLRRVFKRAGAPRPRP